MEQLPQPHPQRAPPLHLGEPAHTLPCLVQWLPTFPGVLVWLARALPPAQLRPPPFSGTPGRASLPRDNYLNPHVPSPWLMPGDFSPQSEGE